MAVSDIKIDAVDCYFGENKFQVEEITCVADVSSSLNSTYFTSYTSAGVKHYYWFDVATTGVDPAIPNATGHAVALSANATAGAVATALAAVMTAVTGYDAVASGPKVTLTHTAAGYASEAMDATLSAKTGFAFKMVTLGDTEMNLGAISGNVEFTKEETTVDVTQHQTGPTILTSIRTGETMELSVAMLETTKSAVLKILARGGGSFIPDTSSGTQVIGHGTGLLGVNTEAYASKLRLHPKRLQNADRTEDINFWRALPIVDAFTFSGEEVFNLPIRFKIFPNVSESTGKLGFWYIGDGSQF